MSDKMTSTATSAATSDKTTSADTTSYYSASYDSYDSSAYASSGYSSYDTAAYSAYSYNTETPVYANSLYYGSINYQGDHDVYDVYLYAGQSYTFDVHGNYQYSQYGWVGDPTLALLSSSYGSYTLVDYDDDSGPGLDSQISYTPTASGWYELVVGAYNNSYTGGYLLET
jgi:hypothetical protein